MKALCSSADGANDANSLRDLQARMDEERCCGEESCVVEKKRRLNIDQVKALEKIFEVDNKLEPERKLNLAQELGLQPRQVAVWFQNRRARYKTKQLEKDYGVLKAEYDALKLSFEKLHHENETFLKEIEDLKIQLKENEEKEKKEMVISEESIKFKIENLKRKELIGVNSDSDSSAVVNEDNSNSPTAAISSSGVDFPVPIPAAAAASQVNPSLELSSGKDIFGEAQKAYYPHLVKIEEYSLLDEDSCSSFFADDQAPSLHWYSSV